jgi:hypothetical protein
MRVGQIITNLVQSWLRYVVDEVSLWRHFVSFLLMILIFGILYALLTPYGQGLSSEGLNHPDNTLLNSLYFSVVTVTTLGYGDIHPYGISKVLACLEVLLGLAAIGIAIAKITSRRLSHHVEHLFSTDAQVRLKGMCQSLNEIREKLSAATTEIQLAFQAVPGSTPSPDARLQATATFARIVSESRAACEELCNYLTRELGEVSDYFECIPTEPLRLIGVECDVTMGLIGQVLFAIPENDLEELLGRQTRQHISLALAAQGLICQLVTEGSGDASIKELFQNIEVKLKQIDPFVTTPPAMDLPDHALEAADVPR